MSDAAKCFNCPRPSMYRVLVSGDTSILLCLECMAKHQQIAHRAEQAQRERLEALMRLHNYHSAELDMISGISTAKYQIPHREQVVYRHEVNLHNIKIEGSNIAVLNTGSIGSLDLAIGQLGSDGQREAADALKGIAEAVAASKELDAATKNEVLDTLSIIAAEATVPEPQRRKAPMLALLKDTATILGGVGALAQLWQQFGQAILQLFR